MQSSGWRGAVQQWHQHAGRQAQQMAGWQQQAIATAPSPNRQRTLLLSHAAGYSDVGRFTPATGFCAPASAADRRRSDSLSARRSLKRISTALCIIL